METGTHRWNFKSERCKELGEKWRWMNFNSCKKNEFPCKNGQCVDMTFRCDNNYNCQDFSDEKHCNIVTEDDYDEMAPPKILIEDGTDRKTDVKLSIHILSILEVNEIESKFIIKFTMSTS